MFAFCAQFAVNILEESVSWKSVKIKIWRTESKLQNLPLAFLVTNSVLQKNSDLVRKTPNFANMLSDTSFVIFLRFRNKKNTVAILIKFGEFLLLSNKYIKKYCALSFFACEFECLKFLVLVLSV